MTLRASADCPGLGTDVFVPQSLQGAKEDGRSERSASDSERAQALGIPNLPPPLPTALGGSQPVELRAPGQYDSG
ncbi:Cytosolic Phospholipase A2 Epsilon [Manis pentadactyla]|nr:Cytosolic Phospholipase A2 Epsilon [Manis pentadactyla]